MYMIKVKVINDLAKMPQKANKSDAGFDIFSIDGGIATYDESGHIRYIEYGTGLQVEPMSYVHMFVFPRSSIRNKDLILANSIGLIDNGYRGEIKVIFRPSFRTKDINKLSLYSSGERIAQLVPFRESTDYYFTQSLTINETDRGSGGFGSTGS